MQSTNRGAAEVETSLVGPVGVVRICRPPHNYFQVSTLESIVAAYRGFAATDSVRAIVLCSEGRNFSAGADLIHFPGESESGATFAEQVRAVYRSAIELFSAALPVVAAVRGAAVGGGMGLALSATFRVAAEDTRFSAPFSNLGLYPGFGLTASLPRTVGHQRAMDLLVSGRRVNGREALTIGLADRLAENGDVDAAAMSFAAELARAAPLSVRAVMRTLRGDLPGLIREVTEQELAHQIRLRATPDFAEGVLASAQRRPPRFTGRGPGPLGEHDRTTPRHEA